MSPWSLQRREDRAWHCVVYCRLSHHRRRGTHLQEATQQVLDYVHPRIWIVNGTLSIDFWTPFELSHRLSLNFLLKLNTSERTVIIFHLILFYRHIYSNFRAQYTSNT
jgi:hypothetical protein